MGELSNSDSVILAGKIMVISIIVLLLVTIFVMFLHLYAKWHWWQVEVPESHRRQQQRQRPRRLVFVPEAEEMAVSVRRGLDPAVLKSLPIRVFNGVEEEEEECAVCLSEIVEGEKARVLPKCKHAFHVDCIDMWFRSHATCPLCRNPVTSDQSDMIMVITSEISFHSVINPTNAFSTPELRQGASSSSATSSSMSTDGRTTVIDIP